MEPAPHKSLEELIQRELSSLPEQQAPETLIPKVLAQIRERAKRHWWQRPWIQWPFAIQVASAPFLMSGAVGTFYGLSWIWGLLATGMELESVSSALSVAGALWEVVLVLGNALLVLSQTIGQQWLLLAIFVPLIMYLACVAIATACYRVARCHR